MLLRSLAYLGIGSVCILLAGLVGEFVLPQVTIVPLLLVVIGGYFFVVAWWRFAQWAWGMVTGNGVSRRRSTGQNQTPKNP